MPQSRTNRFNDAVHDAACCPLECSKPGNATPLVTGGEANEAYYLFRVVQFLLDLAVAVGVILRQVPAVPGGIVVVGHLAPLRQPPGLAALVAVRPPRHQLGVVQLLD
eukprot:scaffold150785_cov29-Prasinocladus_malaysianus.AAC.1